MFYAEEMSLSYKKKKTGYSSVKYPIGVNFIKLTRFSFTKWRSGEEVLVHIKVGLTFICLFQCINVLNIPS